MLPGILHTRKLTAALCCFSCLVAQLPAAVQHPPSAQKSETPTSAADWFRRADNLTNIRMPGAPPFHLSVTFQALPGTDFSKPGHSPIMTGHGSYEETWLSPQTWRREVALGSYHAVEARALGVRNMQSTSGYEPSRVLMLLDALLNPIPRNLLSPEFRPITDWKVERTATGNLAWVRISSPSDPGVYGFLPNGILIRFEEHDFATVWDEDTIYAGKVIPRRFVIQAMHRDLLTAHVSIRAPLPDESTVFPVSGPSADPGRTLRPLHWYVVKGGYLLNPSFATVGSALRGYIRAVLDRDGMPREAEVISMSGGGDAKTFLDAIRMRRFRPATIDGSPCEMVLGFNGM